jgi:hypothetical protein
MFADSAVPSRAAYSPVRGTGTVHCAEGRGGEGDEQPGVTLHAVGDALAAQKPGADQVEGVARMEVGARFAARLSPVAAADRHTAAGFVAGVVVPQQLTRQSVMGGGVPGKVDRVSAPSNGFDLLQPAREARFANEPDEVALGRGETAQPLSLAKD